MRNNDAVYQSYQAKNDKYHQLGTIAVALILILGFAFVCFTYQTQNIVTKQYLNEISLQSAKRIREKIDDDITNLEATAHSISLLNEITNDKIQAFLLNEYNLYKDESIIRLSYLDMNGVGYAINASGEIKKIAISKETSYFTKAIETKQTVTEIMIDPVTGRNASIYATPVIKNGEVIAVHHGVFLLSKVSSILSINYFNNNGYSYVITKDGTPVFRCSDNENIDNKNLFINDELFNFTINDVTQHIKNSSSDSFITSYDNENYWLTYLPIEYDDLYFVLIVPNSSINRNSDKIVIFSVIILLSMLITSILFLRHMDTIQLENQNELYELACIDEITGIFNKSGFATFIDEHLRIRDLQFAVAYFDVDNFKTFNDLFGYNTGDLLLKHIADVLSENLTEHECSARLNGDNFYTLITYKSQTELENRIINLMNRFADFNFEKNNTTSYDIICRCGIFIVNNLYRDRNVEFYIDRTKMALSSITKSHQHEFAYYNENLRKSMVLEAELENDLKQGLENNQFKVFIQPKYNVKTQKLSGGEALIRWEHPTKGFLTPNVFIDIFEKNGQITEIDFYVLEQVCKLQREWIEKGIQPIVISVNQSRMHLFKNDYFDRLQAMITKYRIDPKYIELEITETVALSNTQLLSQAVDTLHNIGFRVSIDDFGSGQSSFNVLREIDVDVLKIDRGFFTALATSPKGKEIIVTIIGMASRLKIETVSEGIETDEQFQFIKMAGCDLVQGFLFSKPMPLNDFSKLYKNNDEN